MLVQSIAAALSLSFLQSIAKKGSDPIRDRPLLCADERGRADHDQISTLEECEDTHSAKWMVGDLEPGLASDLHEDFRRGTCFIYRALRASEAKKKTMTKNWPFMHSPL
jgi:hypothetical protein